MRTSNPRSWMWSEAIEMLARAERMHRHMFGFGTQHEGPGRACWEPPVDVLETEREVIVFAALPGVDPAGVTLAIEDGVLLIAGQRSLPPELRTAVIHRLELPQGGFRRAVQLPPGRYAQVVRSAANGCLIVTLHKQQARG